MKNKLEHVNSIYKNIFVYINQKKKSRQKINKYNLKVVRFLLIFILSFFVALFFIGSGSIMV